MKWTIGFVAATLLSLNLCAEQEYVAMDKPGYSQDISVGFSDGFDLGYEESILEKQSIRIELSYYPLNEYKGFDQHIYGFGFGWFYYFTSSQDLRGWFLGPSVRLLDEQTNYPSNELYELAGFLGGYQWVVMKKLVLSAGWGLVYDFRLNNHQPNISYDLDQTNNHILNNFELNLGWAF
jgi:hypothetical protein